jgi:hypothetical protein
MEIAAIFILVARPPEAFVDPGGFLFAVRKILAERRGQRQNGR